MRDIEIELSPGAACEEVAADIERAITSAGLTVTRRGSLKKFPGCIHWHVKFERETGTLEVTLWPRERRAWFTIQSGRQAPWMDEKVVLIAAVLGS